MTKFKKKKKAAKPFLKWAGGKGQLLSKFRELHPQELKENKIDYFYEPFLGSGAFFFDIIRNYNLKRAYLYDINEELILAYQVIKNDVRSLIEILSEFNARYHEKDKTGKEEYFYELRKDFNFRKNDINFHAYSDKWITRAAELIFMNRTCYNGLYRVNSKGEFNCPVGAYKNPRICDRVNLWNVSRDLEIAEIKLASYEEIQKKTLNEKSFVYFDPPYRPISRTSSFRSYSRHSFDDDNQRELAMVFSNLDKTGAKIMLSNSDPHNFDPEDNFFDELYKDYQIKRVPAKRMINSKAAGRGEIHEIVVTNY